MLFAILLAATGLTLSSVAIYYSVIGLTAVFAAAFWPVVIMGTTLEVAKLVAASWLKMYWERIPRGMKIYMSTAVVVLMVITSMGIFGFLSKAHLDQNIVSGDVQGKIAIYDEKIATAKGNIDANRRALKQMDEAVDQVMGRSQDEKGADKAVALRRSQAKERTRLLSEIAAEQKTISQLSEERAPVAAEVRKVEAEVGPIKYIAKLIYGDNPDANILEKAVTWVIMVIVFVFDPLAVLLLLGAQMTWQWKKDDESSKEMSSDLYELENYKEQDQELEEEKKNEPFYSKPTAFWPFPIRQNDEVVEEESVKPDAWVADVGEKPTEEELADIDSPEPSAVDEWNKMIAEAEKEAEKEKSAKQQWKEEHPNETIKRQEKLKELGIIDSLPWEIAKEAADSKYQIFPELISENQKTPDPDFPPQDRIKPDLTEVIEPDGSKKKNYIVKTDEHQIKKTRS